MIGGIDPNVIVAGAVTLAGGAGLWGYLGARGKTKADLVTIAQDAAGTVIQGLSDELARLRARVDDLERENLEFRSENRKLIQRDQSIDAWLRRQGIELPGGAEGAYVTIEGDNITALKGRS